jgi:predicted nuclease of predicted toxin-antitoxin system
MKFVIDAQLPSRMAVWLHSAGHDAVHTLDLPEGNRTTDESLADFAEREARVVITKDADFVNSHLLAAKPKKLLLIPLTVTRFLPPICLRSPKRINSSHAERAVDRISTLESEGSAGIAGPLGRRIEHHS